MGILTALLIFVGFLWFADELLTILDVKKFGINREENPIVRWMIRHGPVYFTIFKVFTFAVFVGLISLANLIHETSALVLTGVAALMYLVVVVRNFEVYEKE